MNQDDFNSEETYENQDDSNMNNNNYNKVRYVEELSNEQLVKKYLPMVFLVAIGFIFYLLGIFGYLLNLIALLLVIALIYIGVNTIVFKKEARYSINKIKNIVNVLTFQSKKIYKNYDEATQYIYDKYISEDDVRSSNDNNSYRGVGYDTFSEMEEDLIKEKFNDKGTNPGYIYQNQNKDINYGQFVNNRYYETIRDIDIVPEANKDDLNFNSKKNKYYMNQENSNNLNKNISFIGKNYIGNGNDKLILIDNNLYIDNSIENNINEYKVEIELTTDFEQAILYRNIKIEVNEYNNPVIKGDKVNIELNETHTKATIIYNGFRYPVDFNNTENIILGNNIEIALQ